MGVDYVIDRTCGAKDRHTTDGLLAQLKARNVATAIAAHARAGGDQRPPEQIVATRVLRRPDGDVEVEVTLAQMLAEGAALDRDSAGCRGCPVSAGEAFGCFGYIRYPIPGSAERWLLGRLADDLEAPTVRLLKRMIEDFKYDGAPSRRMRASPGMFFAEATAPRRTWGAKRLLRGYPFAVDTDQLFHAMFHVGSIEPTHGAMLCAIIGMIPLEAVPDRDRLAKAHLDLPDDPAAAELGQFFVALATAAAGGHTVSISA